MKVCVGLIFLCLQCICGVHLVEKHHDETENNHEEENINFESLLNRTKSQTQGLLDLSALQRVLNSLDVQCLSANNIFKTLKVSNETGLNEFQFEEASLLIATDLLHTSSNCTNQPYESVEIARSILFSHDKMCRTDIGIMLKTIRDSRKYKTNHELEKCFSSASILQECTDDRNVTEEAIAKLVLYLSYGFCILPEPLYFQEELLEYLDADPNGFVTEKNFRKLLQKFNLIQSFHDNDHDDNHADEHHEGDHTNNRKNSEHDNDHGDEHDEGDHTNNHKNSEHDNDHDDEHDEGDHTNNHKNSEHDNDHDDEHDDDEHSGNHGNSEHDHEESSKQKEEETHSHEEHEQKCYSASQLLTIAGSTTDSNGEVGLTSLALARICPAIVQQFVTNACIEEHHHRNLTVNQSYTQAQKYGYGTLSVLLISLLALGGLLLFPSIGSVKYQMIMQFFIALGVGTLSGDALLHIIPEYLGLHSHGEKHDHDHDEVEDKSHLYKLLVTVIGIYVFYFFENILRLYNQFKNRDDSVHQHSHTSPGQERSRNHFMTRASISIALESAANGTIELYDENGRSQLNDSSQNAEENLNPNAVCCGVTPVGVMIFIGDALHNLGDGLALGVAFSVSPINGLGTSIAIFCHELPHEFGDFAIYLKNGMTKWQAVAMNFFAACFAFIGLFIGLSVSENEGARQWMLAVIAGMFLYIALVDVLHEMIEEKSEDHPFLLFFLQNLGLIIGWIILLLLALFEDNIRGAFE